MTHKRLIVDVSTGEQYEEELNAKEVAELEAGFAEAEKQKEAEAAEAAAKAALLNRLGITEAEAKLLLS